MAALVSLCNMHASAIKMPLEDKAWVLALPHEAGYSLPTYQVLIFGHMPSLLAMYTDLAGHEPHYLHIHWTAAVRFTDQKPLIYTYITAKQGDLASAREATHRTKYCDGRGSKTGMVKAIRCVPSRIIFFVSSQTSV